MRFTLIALLTLVVIDTAMAGVQLYRQHTATLRLEQRLADLERRLETQHTLATPSERISGDGAPLPTPEQIQAAQDVERIVDAALRSGRLSDADVLKIRQRAEVMTPAQRAQFGEIQRRIAAAYNRGELAPPKRPDLAIP